MSVDFKDISFYFFSSGSTGRPKAIPFTKKEWVDRAKYRKECYKLIGLNSSSRVVILLPFGPWVAGPSVQSALEQLKCTYFPIGLLKDKREVLGLFSIVKEHKIDTIISTPSFIEYIIEVYRSSKNNCKISISLIITSGEYLSNKLRREVKVIFGARVVSTYAASELFVGVECEYTNCYHYNPDVIDVSLSENNKKEKGLLLFTNKKSKAIHLQNYPLGDLGYIEEGECSCRTRWPKVCLKGRTKGTFSVAGGVNVDQSQIIEALSAVAIPITECKILLETKCYGIDKVTFELTIGKEFTINKQDQNQIWEALSELSLDFNDVVSCGQIDLRLRINKSAKRNNKIKYLIKDQRLYER